MKLNAEQQRIDGLLRDVAYSTENYNRLVGEMNAEMKVIQEKFEPMISHWKAEIERADKLLKKTAEVKQGGVFPDGRDELDLPAGQVVRRISDYVRKARGTLERIKEHGLWGGVKITEQVDWETVGKWPDYLLNRIGTERSKKTNIEYSVKEGL